MSMLRSRVFIPGAVIALTLAAVPAHSTIITTYSVQANWLAALTGQQTLDFSGLAPAGGTMNYPSGVSLAGGTIIFTAVNGNLQAVDTGFSSFYNFGTGVALSIAYDRPNGNPAPNFHVVLPANITAFGLNLFTVSPNGASFSVVAAGGTYTVPTFGTPTPAFFGVTANAPISSIDFTVLGTVFNGDTVGLIDNFSFGTADTSPPPSDTPEVASKLLIGSGLVLLAGLKRRARGVRDSSRILEE
jgi:hypothetical protein